MLNALLRKKTTVIFRFMRAYRWMYKPNLMLGISSQRPVIFLMNANNINSQL